MKAELTIGNIQWMGRVVRDAEERLNNQGVTALWKVREMLDGHLDTLMDETDA